MAGSLHQFSFDAYNPADERRREALLALGNGMLLVRGCATSEVADGRHYPGTYRAGLYDRLTSEIEGEPVDNESLVNLPNWLPLTFRARGNSEWFALDRVQILHYRHELDVARGITWREVRFRDRCGRSTRLREERLVSLANPQLAALRVEIEPEDWTGEIEIRSALDGGIRNSNVKRYAPYRNEHLTIIGCDAVEPDLLLMTARTRQSNIAIVTAVRTRVTGDHQAREVHREACSIAGCTTAALVSGAPLVIEKIGAIVTSRDPAIDQPREAGLAALSCAPDFAGMRAAHESAWERLWRRSGIEIARRRSRIRPHFTSSIYCRRFHRIRRTSMSDFRRMVGSRVPGTDLLG